MNKILTQEINECDCQEEDYKFIYDLSKKNMGAYVRKYWGGWDPNKFKKNFKKKNVKIIEYLDGPIGFYDIEFKKDLLYLHNMQIIDSFQRKGIGTYLMSLIEKKLCENKLEKIRLEVFKENPAKDFYLNLGFKIVKDNGNSLTLEKVLF